MTSRGKCLCGDVSYRVTGPMRDVMYCHCEQCRRTSGHFVASTACATADLSISDSKGRLAWFASSEDAKRGFCSQCGSSLFWAPAHGKYVSIMAGTLNVPTGLKAQEHIFVESASDYHEICDGLPQQAAYGEAKLQPPENK